MHRRLAPRGHRFAYPVFYALLPMHRLDDWAEKMLDHFNYVKGYWRLTTGVAGTRLVQLGAEEIERLMGEINRAQKN